MAKIVELVGWSIGIGDTEIIDMDERGNVVHDAVGQPKMLPAKELMFIEPATGEVIKIALSEQAKTALVRGLTGGIEIAANVPVLQ